MSDWWRKLPAPAQDALAAVAFAVAWFAAYDHWRQRGWMPVRPETFQAAGLWSAATLALRRVWPGWVLVAAVAAYPLAYGGGDPRLRDRRRPTRRGPRHPLELSRTPLRRRNHRGRRPLRPAAAWPSSGG